MKMTIRKITENYGVSRRAIQGYEKAGLITASGKTTRGYLLYDETTQERIKLIKFLQQIGFTVKEITNIIDAPNEILKPVLKSQLIKLQEHHEDTRQLILKLSELIKALS